MSGTSRAFLPREHGAYFELGFPLLSGLTMTAPTVTSAVIAVSACLFFLSHESLAVLSGVRGRRVQEESGGRARIMFTITAGIGAVTGMAGLLLAESSVRLAALVPLAFAAALAPWVIRRRQKSLVAELLVVGVFATLVLPVGAAGGLAWSLAWTVAAVWIASFVPSTVVVHALKLHHKGRSNAGGMRVAGSTVALGVGGGAVACAVNGAVPPLVAAALLPQAAAGFLLSVRPVHPRNLKRVGWTLVGTSTITWLCLLYL
jgi:hypothetical protein